MAWPAPRRVSMVAIREEPERHMYDDVIQRLHAVDYTWLLSLELGKQPARMGWHAGVVRWGLIDSPPVCAK